jgi:hypothetical protein
MNKCKDELKLDKTLLLHVDIDSPRTLMNFWGLEGEEPDSQNFYELAMQRALEFFNKLDVKVTFFCVGQEIKQDAKAASQIKAAFDQGHEIANHSQTHTYQLSKMTSKEIEYEIDACTEEIKQLTGIRPLGFRAPSYEMNERVMDVLRDRGFAYDSSAFWSALQGLIKQYYAKFTKNKTSNSFGTGTARIPNRPYYPSKTDWQAKVSDGASGSLLEIPVTRTDIFQLPFYNNFHLKTPVIYRELVCRSMRQPVVIYLIHLIEFADMDDGLHAGLKVHPNLSKNYATKSGILKNFILQLKQRYKVQRTDDFVSRFTGLNQS